MFITDLSIESETREVPGHLSVPSWLSLLRALLNLIKFQENNLGGSFPLFLGACWNKLTRRRKAKMLPV